MTDKELISQALEAYALYCDRRAAVVKRQEYRNSYTEQAKQARRLAEEMARQPWLPY